jgi:hypothetical protein
MTNIPQAQVRQRIIIWVTFPLTIVFIALAIFVSSWFAILGIASEVVFSVCLYKFVTAMLALYEAERKANGK